MILLQQADRSRIQRRKSSTQYLPRKNVVASLTTRNLITGKRWTRRAIMLCSFALAVLSLLLVVVFWIIQTNKYHDVISNIAFSQKPENDSLQSVIIQILKSIQETQEASFSTLPQWMKEYMSWHRQQMLLFLKDAPSQSKDMNTFFRDNKQYKFLIARCIDESVDASCGGLSDRLKTLPTLLLLAHQSKRILLLYWSRPMRMEEFLLPPSEGYLNWSIPMIGSASPSKEGMSSFVPLIPVQGMGTRLYTKLETLVKAVQKNSTIPILCTRLQDQHGGSEYYNSHPLVIQQSPSQSHHFRRIFRALFFTLFQPSPLVLKHLAMDTGALVRQLQTDFSNDNDETGTQDITMHSMELWPTGATTSISKTAIPYVVAHLRAFYGNHEVTPSQIVYRAMNAIDCAKLHSIPSNLPILFLSDSSLAIDHVTGQARRKQNKAPVVLTLSRNATAIHSPGVGGDGTDRVILHLDKSTGGIGESAPLEYVSIFTDLYFMSNGQCIAYGQGGYGRMGSLLQRNPFCFYNYFQNSQFLSCTQPGSFG